jgi:hypothetical protein
MGGSLSPGKSLTSADGCYKLILQRTGALIGYSVLDKAPFWDAKVTLLRSGNYTGIISSTKYLYYISECSFNLLLDRIIGIKSRL